jgi:AcrR family transcriptional regulator
MAIPAQARDGREPWAQLDADGKRGRLLAAAETVFARDGLEAPVPAIAAAAGAGVGSVYRAFASKEAIVAALAVERLEWFREQAAAALEEPDAGAALETLLRVSAARQSADGVLGEALAVAFQLPEADAARASATEALDGVLARAREQGAVRADATGADLRMLFAACRAADAVEPGGWRRMLDLGLAGLRA